MKGVRASRGEIAVNPYHQRTYDDSLLAQHLLIANSVPFSACVNCKCFEFRISHCIQFDIVNALDHCIRYSRSFLRCQVYCLTRQVYCYVFAISVNLHCRTYVSCSRPRWLHGVILFNLDNSAILDSSSSIPSVWFWVMWPL